MNIEPMLLAVRQAMMLCREVQHNCLHSASKFSADKQESEPVTIADYGSQAILGRALRLYFPDDAVVSEESGAQFLNLLSPEKRAHILNLLNSVLDIRVTQDDVVQWLDQGKDRQAARTWVIDPIDGTKGFIEMRHYAVGVGYIEDGQPVGGIIGAPGYGDGISGYDEDGAIFYVEAGVAYKQSISGGTAERIQVSDRTEPASLRAVQSYEEEHSDKERSALIRQTAGYGAASVQDLDSMEKYALIACGDADIFLRIDREGHSNRQHLVWDHVPGVALVLAAGGRATDTDGNALDFSNLRNVPTKGFIVSSPATHSALVQAAQALLRS